MGDISGSPVTTTPCFPRRAPEFHPWSGNRTPHAAAKNSHAAATDPMHRSRVQSPRAPAKTRHSQVNKYTFKEVEDQDLSSEL